MRFSKIFSIFTCCLLMLALGTVWAASQKKDGKDSSQPTAPKPLPPTPYSNVKRDSLLNGLQIVSLERAGDSAVKIDLDIHAGAMYDLVGKTGLAKLTQETLLATNPRLKEELESLQAKIDWGVDWDTTWFHIETPANNFEAVLEILARLLVVENVRAESFKRAQQEHLARIKSSQPSLAERTQESFLKALYGDHPYGHNIDGNEATIEGIKQGDIYDFMKRLYLANDVSAIVVGNISHEHAMRAFKTFFGGWTKGQIAPSTFRAPRQVNQLNLVKIEAPEASGIEMRGGVLGVKYTDPDFLTTELMARILATRLKKNTGGSALELAVKSAPRILPGPFFFTASVPTDQAPALVRRVTEDFAALAASPISAEELTAVKSELANEYSSRPVEYYLREIEVYALPRNFPEKVGPRIEKITAEDLHRVAKKMIDANALTIVAVGKVNESFKSNP